MPIVRYRSNAENLRLIAEGVLVLHLPKTEAVKAVAYGLTSKPVSHWMAIAIRVLIAANWTVVWFGNTVAPVRTNIPVGRN